jgi:hypothetical protein
MSPKNKVKSHGMKYFQSPPILCRSALSPIGSSVSGIHMIFCICFAYRTYQSRSEVAKGRAKVGNCRDRESPPRRDPWFSSFRRNHTDGINVLSIQLSFLPSRVAIFGRSRVPLYRNWIQALEFPCRELGLLICILLLPLIAQG